MTLHRSRQAQSRWNKLNDMHENEIPKGHGVKIIADSFLVLGIVGIDTSQRDGHIYTGIETTEQVIDISCFSCDCLSIFR